MADTRYRKLVHAGEPRQRSLINDEGPDHRDHASDGEQWYVQDDGRMAGDSEMGDPHHRSPAASAMMYPIGAAPMGRIPVYEGFSGSGPQDKHLLGIPGVNYTVVLLFMIAAMLLVMTVVILMLALVLTSGHSVVTDIVSRSEPFVDIARAVAENGRMIWREMGDGAAAPEDSLFRSHHGATDGSGGLTEWMKPRSDQEEAMLSEHAIKVIVRIIRSTMGILEQADESRITENLSRFARHTDELMASPQAMTVLETAAMVSAKAEVHVFADQTMALLSHIESALLPVVDVLAAEIRLELASMVNDPPDGDRFKQLVLEITDAVHKVGGGLRDAIVWYREGGPSDAATLANDLIRSAKELVESPAAESLVKVLESIDWKETGDEVAQAAHNAGAIVQTINEAGTVGAVDRLTRAVAGVLENPSTGKAVAMIPGLVSNATALLARPNSQKMLTQATELMTTIEQILSDADKSRAIQRSAEFMDTMHVFLDGLVHSGLRLEFAENARSASDEADDVTRGPEDGGDQVKDVDENRRQHHKRPALLPLPHYVGTRPDRPRGRRRGS